MRKRTSEGGRRSGNPAPRSRFSTVGAATLLTYPTRLCRCLKGRAKELRHIAPPPTHSAFFIGPREFETRNVTCVRPACKRGRVPPRRRRQDGGVRGAGMSEVAARGRVAEQVQLFGDPASGRGTARAKPGSGERSRFSVAGSPSGVLEWRRSHSPSPRARARPPPRTVRVWPKPLCPFHSTRDKKTKI